ncbi:chaperone modulator CbpM [Kribbella sp. NPDC051137]|uniref:chaperone modulator CbpM n=1 Tax=Kribbella sp. NPDC051137 TaxID=3155045 RepID=UPI00343627D7
MTIQIVPRAGLGLDEFCRLTDLHPDLARRFVALGLLEATTDADGQPRFSPGQLARVARIRRLRAGFALNYASLGLVLDLLDRIAVLEAQRRRRDTAVVRTSARTGARTGARTWT